jgi:hypothetical protein
VNQANPPTNRFRPLLYLLIAVIFLSPLSCLFVVHQMKENARRSEEPAARKQMRQEIADWRAGKNPRIVVTDRGNGAAMSEFVLAKDTFQKSDNLDLEISYVSDADPFLKQLAGVRGISAVYLLNSYVSDLGIQAAATFPDLKTLMITKCDITDAGIAALQTMPHLEVLHLAAHRANPGNVRALVSHPKVRKLCLEEPQDSDWLAEGIAQVEPATSLEELILISDKITPEALQSLRRQLPNCNIKLRPKKGQGK